MDEGEIFLCTTRSVAKSRLGLKYTRSISIRSFETGTDTTELLHQPVAYYCVLESVFNCCGFTVLSMGRVTRPKS